LLDTDELRYKMHLKYATDARIERIGICII
jgi:hypothetical protein